MGKGTIISDLGDGLYNVQMIRDIWLIDQMLAFITARLAELTVEKAAKQALKTTKQNTLDVLRTNIDNKIFDLSIASTDSERDALTQEIIALMEPSFAMQSEIDDLTARIGMIELSETKLTLQQTLLTAEKNEVDSREVWCVDLTEGKTGDVPTCEINGEIDDILVYPGSIDEAQPAIPTATGQLVPVIGQSTAQACFNFAIFPGWQKWKPTFRIGTISNINHTANTCNVTLDAAISHFKKLNINQADSLTGITIKYMDCNSSAFTAGDRVVVQFVGQAQATPRVIGFESNPKPCKPLIVVVSSQSGAEAFAWDTQSDTIFISKTSLTSVLAQLTTRGFTEQIQAQPTTSANDTWAPGTPPFYKDAVNNLPIIYYGDYPDDGLDYEYSPPWPYLYTTMFEFTHYYTEAPTMLDDMAIPADEQTKAPWLINLYGDSETTPDIQAEFESLTGVSWPGVAVLRQYLYFHSMFDFELDGYPALKSNLDSVCYKLFDSWRDCLWWYDGGLQVSESNAWIESGIAENTKTILLFEYAGVCFDLDSGSDVQCENRTTKYSDMFRIWAHQFDTLTGYAEEGFILINEIRASNGLLPLKLNICLNKAAKRHASDMARTGFLSHTGSDGTSPHERIAEEGYLDYMLTGNGYQTVENIAYAMTPAQAVQAWLDSPPHLAAILNSNVVDTGFAAKVSTGGVYYWVQTFGKVNRRWPGFSPISTTNLKTYMDANFTYVGEPVDGKRTPKVYIC